MWYANIDHICQLIKSVFLHHLKAAVFDMTPHVSSLLTSSHLIISMVDEIHLKIHKFRITGSHIVLPARTPGALCCPQMETDGSCWLHYFFWQMLFRLLKFFDDREHMGWSAITGSFFGSDFPSEFNALTGCRYTGKWDGRPEEAVLTRHRRVNTRVAVPRLKQSPCVWTNTGMLRCVVMCRAVEHFKCISLSLCVIYRSKV